MKVELLREPSKGWRSLSSSSSVVTRALPFYRSTFSGGRYVHRIRSANMLEHYETVDCGSRRVSSTPATRSLSLRLWCGQSGHVRLATLDPCSVWARGGTSGELLAEPPAGAPVCATCEGRAVGAGFPSRIVLTTRPIRFAPRLEETAQAGEKPVHELEPTTISLAELGAAESSIEVVVTRRRP